VAALQDISEVLAVHIGCFFPQDTAGSVKEREHIVRKPNRRRLTYSELSGTEYLACTITCYRPTLTVSWHLAFHVTSPVLRPAMIAMPTKAKKPDWCYRINWC
jgi:hypothetical protein